MKKLRTVKKTNRFGRVVGPDKLQCVFCGEIIETKKFKGKDICMECIDIITKQDTAIQ